ncbi:hypothetical protein IP70_15675 [alpha proteobacterium AAP38]|nr:hypothetical protein IP70_15675 [alpha proteobacterium AAP38]
MDSAGLSRFIRQSPQRETVVVRRQTGVSPVTWTDAVVPARVRQYGAAELVAGITQGDFEVVVAHADLVAAGWLVPPKDGDRVIRFPTIANGAYVPGGSAVELTVRHPGDRGGRIGYWLQARGGGVR